MINKANATPKIQRLEFVAGGDLTGLAVEDFTSDFRG